MSAKQILVLGGGFAGLWSAIGAARKLDELGYGPEAAEVTLVNRDGYHSIRVRNYEADLSAVRVPLHDVLGPAGIRRLEGEVAAIDLIEQTVRVNIANGQRILHYDRLVFTLGSELARPAIPGLAANSFDVDTYAAALRLDAHLAELGKQATSDGRSTAVVVGAGFTGIEVATELPGKLDRAGVTGDRRIILIDPNPVVGATIGEPARPVITEALSALGVELRLDVKVDAVDANGITLSSGEFIPTRTVVWCAGMRASPLAATLPVERDSLGRLRVDSYMRAAGLTNVFAAGDVACGVLDGVHSTVMSCQFARPMGRFAGHNVMADLFGEPMLPLDIDWYVTVLDLGAWGALYTVGWDRKLRSTGAAAKATKQTINHKRIYPPRTGRADLLAAAAPTIQAPPDVRSR